LGRLQNLGTVAVFLSPVNTTAIQYILDQSDTLLSKFVNTLWIGSLVLSLACTVNTQLLYHWHSSQYCSPIGRVPWIISMWISFSPIAFLIGSMMAFSSGLVAFAFMYYAHHIVLWVVASCMVLTWVSLLLILFWLFGEKYTFMKTKGRHWFADYSTQLF
jgi:WD repeat-containing protein 26